MSILTQPLYEQFGAPTLLYRNLCAWVDSPAAGPHAATPWIRCQSEFNASNHLTTETRLMELDAMHLLTRLQHEPGYLKGIPINSMQRILRSEQEMQQKIKVSEAFRDDIDLETHDYYGNCLQIMKCGGVKENGVGRSSCYVVRPWGSYRNKVCLSKILFPASLGNSDVNDPDSVISGTQERDQGGNKLHPPQSNNTIDLQAPIRQIVRCGHDIPQSCSCSSQFETLQNTVECSLGWFMVRTRTHCSLLRVTPSHTQHGRDEGGLGAFADDKDDLGAMLEEIERIDLHELTTIVNDVPRYCTGYLDAGGSFGSPIFAIAGSENTIHQVIVGYDGILPIQTYTFESISKQKMIEYSSHPMILWSSASLKRGDFGNMLFQLDMRSRTAARVWSASNANFMVDGMCTIRSFLQHPTKDYTAYATSSLGKLYELDTRMPVKEVTTWVLPGQVERYLQGDDILALADTHIPDDDMSFFSSSVPSSSVEPSTILAVHKAPLAYGLRLYQSPLRPPRFGSVPLEAGPYCEVSGVSCIARSTVYALPDYSRKVFHCGLASIRVPLKFLLDDSMSWEYSIPPTHALCVLTLTSMGDIYCHTLVACDREEPRQAIAFEGLSGGMSAIPVPGACVSSFDPRKSEDERFLQIYLNNQYSVPSSAILPCVSSKDDVRPFRTVPIPPEATRQNNNTGTVTIDSEASNEPSNSYKMTKVASQKLAAQPRAHWEIQRHTGCRPEEVEVMVDDAVSICMGVNTGLSATPASDVHSGVLQVKQASGGNVPATVAGDSSDTVRGIPAASARVSFSGREAIARKSGLPALKERRSDVSKDKIAKLEKMWDE